MERGSRVAILFARARSVYYGIPGCDVFDQIRDARTFGLDSPVVAHPPCAQWSRWLFRLAKPRQSEKDLAPWAVDVVRRCGGVLEHPAYSRLWDECSLPRPVRSGLPIAIDEFGGFSIEVFQSAYGHKVPKRTWLYICGCSAGDLAGVRRGGFTRRYPFPSLSMAQRSGTPLPFAKFLVRTARLCRWSADLVAPA
jgi:hypothetical protein